MLSHHHRRVHLSGAVCVGLQFALQAEAEVVSANQQGIGRVNNTATFYWDETKTYTFAPN